VLISILGFYYVSTYQFSKAIRNSSEEDLEHLVRNIYSMCILQQELIRAQGNFDLDISINEQSTISLKDIIKGIKVGKTGYVYVMDSSGTLKIHPAKEGENIIDSIDSSGFRYIKAMTIEALKLREKAIATIHYPWINPELGEKGPRQKIAKYTYFEPWDWIIVAGTYENEIYESLYTTTRSILILAFISIILVFFLAIKVSKVLTDPIQELTEITTKMVDGDLSQRIKVQGADEIGVLGTTFNLMISQIQDSTINLEKMVEERTQELNESKERYRDLSLFLHSILESATKYSIIAVDFYGKIMEFNKGAERIFGWKKEDVVNKENIRITIPPEEQEREIQKEISLRTRTEGVCELEVDRVRKNGERFPTLTTITAIEDPTGEVTGFVVITRDLTRRKSLERELRETKEFLENIMESSVDVIVTTDLKGKITYINHAIEEMLRYRKDELLGKHISVIYVDGIQRARDIMDILRKSERAENYEMEIKGKNGENHSISTSLFLLRDEDGQIMGTAGIFKDITAQKILEDKLKAAQVRLVETSKIRALGELVAGVAHELNNPLMASKAILHVIFKNVPKDWPERDRLELIRRCNDRIEKIVEHLREFSRQTEPDFQEIDINRPIENALLISEQHLLNQNISIERRLFKDLPKILGDPNQLEQVFLNLIYNARDAMEEVTEPKKLIVSSSLTDDNGPPLLAVSVKDTGVGIPPGDLHKVLEPFYTTKPVGKGTGLGLSLCFGIVETHKGRIEIRNRDEKGAEVRVLFPVKES
jgi:PAS domain S-box-containing protein